MYLAQWMPWPVDVALGIIASCLVLYLLRVNYLLRGTPAHFQKLAGPRWTAGVLKDTYRELSEKPIDYTDQLPPKLDRRYIVTGGAGLVGGYIVLQLLARGTPVEAIRIVDIRRTERTDLLNGPAAGVDFVKTDITSPKSVADAFSKPWDASVSHLPLTVFHTAAVIIPSDRSKHLYAFPEAVNVGGTRNVLEAARRAGASIFSSTSSASIPIRPVQTFVAPWATEPGWFAQVLDEDDFYKPLRAHEDFFGNYPASKAVAERIVCDADSRGFRTGCIRPGNGVYGNPTDNTVGGPLSKTFFPTWIPHVVQSFAHGANVAIAHLHHEAALLRETCPQSGRPFVVTDPNPAITYSDLNNAVRVLSIHPFYPITLPPVLCLLMAYAIEWYNLLPYRVPRWLRYVIPKIPGDVKYLQPGLFSICTHLVASDAQARKSVEEGGLGYRGVLTTLQGMALEVLEWNREHPVDKVGTLKRAYTTSVTLAETIQRLGVNVADTKCNE